MVANPTKSDGRSFSLLYLLGAHIPPPSSDRKRIRIEEKRKTPGNAKTRIFTRAEKEIIKRVCEGKDATPEEVAEWSNCSVETIRTVLKYQNNYRWRQKKKGYDFSNAVIGKYAGKVNTSNIKELICDLKNGPDECMDCPASQYLGDINGKR